MAEKCIKTVQDTIREVRLVRCAADRLTDVIRQKSIGDNRWRKMEEITGEKRDERQLEQNGIHVCK